MKKAEVIERYGKEEYQKKLEREKKRNKKEVFIAKHGEDAWEKKLETQRAKMKKESYIAKYGEDAWQRWLVLNREWALRNPEKMKVKNYKTNAEQNRKGGKYYEKMLEDNKTGLRGARNKVRNKHRGQYLPFKRIIAPGSQLHHQWKPDSAEYTGVALVEAKPHQYGIIDVIQILDGKITLLTEEEVKNGKKNEDEKEPETAVLLQ